MGKAKAQPILTEPEELERAVKALAEILQRQTGFPVGGIYVTYQQPPTDGPRTVTIDKRLF